MKQLFLLVLIVNALRLGAQLPPPPCLGDEKRHPLPAVMCQPVFAKEVSKPYIPVSPKECGVDETYLAELKLSKHNYQLAVDSLPRQIHASSLVEALAFPERVVSLNLSYQDFTELPVEVASMVNLRALKLRQNKLAQLPAFLADLKHLELLDLSFNKFEEIPDVIFELERLEG